MSLASPKLIHANPVVRAVTLPTHLFGNSAIPITRCGTGDQEAKSQTLGKIFPIIQIVPILFNGNSRATRSFVRIPDLGTHFWAPEVAYAEGKFFLYYSVGHDDKNHQLRVAISDSPQDRITIRANT